MKTAVRVLVGVALLVGQSLVMAGATYAAASVYKSGSTLYYTAAAGTANDVTVSRAATLFVVSDSGDTLVAGSGCTATADPHTVTCLAAGVALIQLRTGDGADAARNLTSTPARLFGGAGKDLLEGGSGPDRLDGGLDADVMLGGAGRDTASYSTRTRAVTVTLDDVANDGEVGELDSVRSDVENVVGGSGSDRIVGSGAANTFQGNAGADTLDGRGGGDLLDGGVGNDVLLGGAGGDRLQGAEGLDRLWGSDGNDRLDGGFGADLMDGGAGTDTAYYATRSGSLRVILNGLADDGQTSEGDNVATNVENVTGGSAGDVLRGSSVRNVLSGGAGPDTISGFGGNDVLLGGPGVDTLNGGSGTDSCDVGADGGTTSLCESS